MLIKEKVSEAIVLVTKELHNPRMAFEAKAKEVAMELGMDAIEMIPSFFHNPPEKPE